jgi:hypothetical protein
MAFTQAGSLYENITFVMPAQAGIQEKWPLMVQLDPGLRRDDSIGRDWGQAAPLAFESAALAAS